MGRFAILLAFLGCSETGFELSVPPVEGSREPLLSDRLIVEHHASAPLASDVLFVIDNSCSMGDSQVQLIEHFESFVRPIVEAETDYHVGVITTDMENNQHRGRLVRHNGTRWIDKNTPNPVADFQVRADVGAVGGGFAIERGLETTWLAMVQHREDANDGFFRSNADFHIVLISDDKDYSKANIVTLNEFISYLQSEQGDGKKVSFNPIVTPRNNCPQGVNPGLKYLQVMDEIGGVSASICDDDWTGFMEQVGFNARGAHFIYLREQPIVETIEVIATLETDLDTFVWVLEHETDFTYDERKNALQIVRSPPDGSNYEISYISASDSMTDRDPGVDVP